MKEAAASNLLNLLGNARLQKEANMVNIAKNLFNTLKTYGSNAAGYGKAFFDEFRPRGVNPSEWMKRNTKAEEFMRAQGGTMPRNRFTSSNIHSSIKPEVQNNNKQMALNALAGVGGFGAGYGGGYLGTKALGSVFSRDPNKPYTSVKHSNFIQKTSAEKQADLIGLLGQLGILGLKGIGKGLLFGGKALGKGLYQGGKAMATPKGLKATAVAGAIGAPTGYGINRYRKYLADQELVDKNIKLIKSKNTPAEKTHVEPLPTNWAKQPDGGKVPPVQSTMQALFGR
jgi:hypothetical protein